MLKQMRETLTAAQQTAAEQAANKANGANGVEPMEQTGQMGQTERMLLRRMAREERALAYTKNQKPRQPKSGVTLVKPSGANPRPEDEIARDASSSANGKTMTPEDAIKRDASSDGEEDESDA